jgi:hypothetical protein
MKIACLGLREGGTKVDIDGIEYHFEPLADGAHVADVEDEAHIDRFLSISDHYKVYHGKLEPTTKPVRVAPAGKPRVFVAPQKTADVLYGSSVHESSYEIGGKTYSLGDIVALAHKTSELTVEEWNELDEGDRHAKIDITLDDLADAAEKAEAQKPEAPEAPAAGESDERAALVEQYVAKFGKKPHYNASVETIKAKLAE